VLIPVLYLKGISTGDFEKALAALVGQDAPGLSASTIARLKDAWTEEHARWQKRDLSARSPGSLMQANRRTSEHSLNPRRAY
jgi:putative transposase